MPKSTAFEQAVAEVVRIWDAADHLDTKILQFTSIITVGFLAAGGILGRSAFRNPAAVSTCMCSGIVGTLVVLGVLAFAVFFALTINAAVGSRFGGPLDPRVLAKRPDYVDDNALFERDMLPHIATAFDQSTRALQQKLRLFRYGICALGFAFAFIATAALLVTCSTNPERSKTMTEVTTPTTPTEQPAAPAPSTAPASSPQLAPYTVERSLPRVQTARPAPGERDTTK